MILTEPTPVFYFVSLLYRDDHWDQQKISNLLSERFENLEFHQGTPSTMNDYYTKEMGDIQKLQRLFVFFKKASSRDDFVSHKLWACKQEENNCIDQKRSINIDIGLLALEHVLLATGKPYYHRPYLGQGVYADVTLYFEKKSYRTLSWTYPDYALAETIQLLNTQRSELLQLIGK